MIEVVLAVQNENALTKTGQSVEHLLDHVLQIVQRDVKSHGDEVLLPFRATPGGVKHPIRWTSERQRRAFFATDGFGRGIPTVRTGQLAAAWTLETTYDAGAGVITVSAENAVPYEVFVSGQFQQGFHVDTGWGNSAAIADQQGQALGSLLSADIGAEVAL